MPRFIHPIKSALLFNRVKQIIILSCLVIVLILPYFALAEGNQALDKLQAVGSTNGPYVGVGWNGVSQIIGAGISAALALIGVVFLVLMIYAGFKWMTARGEEEKVEKAKDTITRAIIGLIIVIGAYAIWAFIYSKLF